jgi:hypothetical protein
MSVSFRPVEESFNRHSSSCFLSPREVCQVLSFLAQPQGASWNDNDDQYLRLWIENGREFLEKVAGLLVTPSTMLKLAQDSGLDLVDIPQLTNLVGNMANLAKDWQGSVDREDGSLTFYIDAY